MMIKTAIIGAFAAHKAAAVSCSVAAGLVLTCGGVGAATAIDNAIKDENTQQLMHEATQAGYISADRIAELEANGGLAELGTEIVDPTTGETVVLTEDENGNIKVTVVKDASGNYVASSPSNDSSSTQQTSESSGGSSYTEPAQESTYVEPTPTTPVHTHNWIAQTTRQYVVDEAAHNEVQTIEREPVIRNGREFRNFDFVDVWVPEKGHYETVVTGYVCDCGACK